MDPKSVLIGDARCGARLFYAPGLGREHIFNFERTRPPNWRTTSANLWFPCPIFDYMHFIFMVFCKKWSPPGQETHFWRSTHTILHTTFWTPNWSLKSQFSYLCSSLPLLCSFGLVFFRSWSQLGANLGPTCANLGPISANLGPTWC